MIETAAFGAGCFWGVEKDFQDTPGVIKTRVGFMGGTLENPSYEDVSSGDTQHVEAVEVQFDTARITYEDLLERFWSIHSAKVDPQWKEMISRQYQSVVFYRNEEQKMAAEKKKRELERGNNESLSTVFEPASTFYEAEERHQNYVAKRNAQRAG